MNKPGPMPVTIQTEEGEEPVLMCEPVDATDANPADYYRIPHDKLASLADAVEELRRRHDGVVAENRRLRAERDEARRQLHRERIAHIEQAKESQALAAEIVADRILADMPDNWDVAHIIEWGDRP